MGICVSTCNDSSRGLQPSERIVSLKKNSKEGPSGFPSETVAEGEKYEGRRQSQSQAPVDGRTDDQISLKEAAELVPSSNTCIVITSNGKKIIPKLQSPMENSLFSRRNANPKG
eukprot:TRINITY_DN737_c0_g1_i4.p1 TRINITY_DN737_c0_g1~~TRINITY_DN737_c0_g1_i4.p1  ORF type:complete len:114 (-),score=12.74 TRINITY_DN737_c0_g1_i4:202-543(-)